MLGRLVPGRPKLAAHLERGDGGELVILVKLGLLDESRLHSQEPDLYPHEGGGGPLEHALGLHRPGLGERPLAERARREHTELPPELILRG